jgi:hypothetical protein
MGAPSSVELLPPEIKSLINEWLETKAFSDYDGLVELLAGHGHEISRTALHRYGKGQKDLRKSGMFAAGIYNESGGDYSKLAVVTQALIQQKAFELLTKYDFDIEHLEPEDRNNFILQIMRFAPGAAKAHATIEDMAIKREASIAEAKQKQAKAEQELARIKKAAEELLQAVPTDNKSGREAVARFRQMVLNADV